MELNEDQMLHYGIKRRSGRYPWGSGGDDDGYSEDRRNPDFLDTVAGLRAKGLTESQVAQGMGMSIAQLRARKSIAKNEQRAADVAMAERLKAKGMSTVAIGERMGKPESTIRSYLAPGAKDRADILQNTADMLKSEVDSKGFIDVGSGSELFAGVSATRLQTSVAILQEQGYTLHTVKVPQLGTGLDTTVKVLAPPGTSQRDVFLNRDKIRIIGQFSEDGGRSYTPIMDPLSISPNRLQVKYKDDGGAEADGVVFVRPGVKDISLGGTPYAQVRIQIGDNKYIKGMAMYKDDLPEGVDLVFHTNKERTGNKLDALKDLKDDPDLPFGSLISRQIGDNLGTPKAKVTSAMNIVNEQGDWEKWNKSLSSQMLSKQSPALVRSQLAMTYERRQAQFDEIQGLTNPVVRKRLLEDFADGTDAASVHLKAAALPRQATHVILPLRKIDPGQVYAPNYENGTAVVLIRHPHGGPFEIPRLVVNNRNAEGRRLLAGGRDAIGIHHTVAQRLSGADFDGDTVLVIPDNARRIIDKPGLKGLEGFDPQTAYRGYPGMKKMKNTQTQMGIVSNLITDMSLRQASDKELERAVKHSMVVIDAEKHGLDYKRSYVDNGIADLKKKYQQGGASTIISRAKSRIDVPERKPRTQGKGGPVDRKTGELRFEPTGRINPRTGRPKTIQSTKLAEARDAHTLSSGTPVERLYADHSNRLKGLANQARLASINTPLPRQSPSARRTYSDQVASLDAKLRIAIRNRPLERQAQVIANANVSQRRRQNPDMDSATLKKVKNQALAEARARTGAGKQRIEITDLEWEAIQAGAVSASKLNDILQNANMDRVRELSTPRSARLMTSAKTNRAKQMLAAGYTRAEVAAQLGVSLSTLDEATVE